MYPQIFMTESELNALAATLYASSAWQTATTDAEREALADAALRPVWDDAITANNFPSNILGQVWQTFYNLVKMLREKMFPSTPANPEPASTTEELFADFVKRWWDVLFHDTIYILRWGQIDFTISVGGGGD